MKIWLGDKPQGTASVPEAQKPAPDPPVPSCPELPPGMLPISKLERAFWVFHEENPRVYRLFVRLARQWRDVHGDGHLGIKMLFERARWEYLMETHDLLGFKLNNNYTAFYARIIMENEPDLAGVFHLRRQRVQAIVGPDDNTLPSGDHAS